MNNEKTKELQDILTYLPMLGVKLVDLAEELRISKSTLYNYKNGLNMKE